MSRTFKLEEILTREELHAIKKLWNEAKGDGSFVKRCSEEIITPSIERINEVTGQKNYPAYLAYAIEYGIRGLSSNKH